MSGQQDIKDTLAQVGQLLKEKGVPESSFGQPYQFLFWRKVDGVVHEMTVGDFGKMLDEQAERETNQ